MSVIRIVVTEFEILVALALAVVAETTRRGRAIRVASVSSMPPSPVVTFLVA
jgi:hypothetical protein